MAADGSDPRRSIERHPLAGGGMSLPSTAIDSGPNE